MIPFEKGLPFIGNLIAYQKDKISFLSKLHKKNGDTFKVKIGNIDLTVVTNPEDIVQIMQENFNNYIKKSNIEQFFGNKNIFLTNGEEWKEQRKMVRPVFKNEHITNFIPIIEKICEEEFSTLLENEAFDIQEFFNKISFKIITSTIIGNEFQAHYQLKEHIKIVTDSLTQMKSMQNFAFLFRKKIKKRDESIAFIDKVIYQIIADKKKSKEFNSDALSMLTELSLQKDSTLSDKEIRDQLVTLIFAGYETTALSMSWLAYLLSRNTPYQNNAREEFQSLSNVSPSDSTQYQTIDNIIKESMRLYPPGWAWSRIALKDDQLKHHQVKAGEILLMSPYLTHRDPKLWPDPTKFSPERFQNEIVKGSFIPFGYGPRTCIGMSLAMIEMRIMLKHLLKHFELIDCNHSPVIRPQITLDVVGGIKVGLKTRPA